jgi:hypothetical protein
MRVAARWPRPFKVAIEVAPMQLNEELPRRLAEMLKGRDCGPRGSTSNSPKAKSSQIGSMRFKSYSR